MALTVDRSETLALTGTQRGVYVFHGIASFTTTDVTGELQIPFSSVFSATATPLGTPKLDEVMSINETPTDGVIARDTSNCITINRSTSASGATSGLKFSFAIIGR